MSGEGAHHQWQVDWGKFGLLTFIVVGSFALRVSNSIESDVFTLVLGAALGYCTGNGLLASKGMESRAMFRPAVPSEGRRVTDPEEGEGT